MAWLPFVSEPARAAAPLFFPSFEQVRAGHQPSDQWVFDRHGAMVGAVRQDYAERRGAWVPLGDISPAMQRAVLLSEDRHFYEHGGVDWPALMAAGWNWAWGSGSRGASTLSMQLVGMLAPELLRPAGGRGLEQKLAQMRSARLLESGWSKAQILEAYLNLAAFRGELRGIDAVSRVMFGKHPHGLDQRESAVAAALLRGPNAGAGRVTARACALLRDGGAAQFCQTLPDDMGAWLAATARPAADVPALAPHFSRLAVARASQAGTAGAVRTTLDARLQRLVLESVQRHLAGMGHAQLTDAAVVVLSNETAEILAYVGSSGHVSAADQVDHARARRQAGSTLKPFLYAQALEFRYLTAASLLEDAPLDVATAGGLYIPQNYDRSHAGWVSVRSALASSLNIPAVRVLMLVGPERFAQRLRSLGLPLLHDGEYYGYSLSLGSADVDLLSLTNAYRTLADQGRWRLPVILQGESPAGGPPAQRFSPQASWIVGDMLSDRRARARTFGLESALATRFWSAVKTGTSKDMRDNWALGWSSDYTVGVWVGNSQGLSMRDVSGVSGAGPIWHEVMSALHEHRASAQPLPPPDVERRQVVFEQNLEASRMEYFLPGTAVSRIEPAFTRSAPRSRILSPSKGTVIAFDPDMPAAHQQLVLRADAGGVAPELLRWHIEGRHVADGQASRWPLSVGRHRIVLSTAEGVVLDEVTIQVRGLPRLSGGG
ncbi:MAG: penicillin-binding protein 1C [Alcaligenaceae bacterium]|nr:penicillin-binding protein 1C [Alcaligenaceae bacterium]